MKQNIRHLVFKFSSLFIKKKKLRYSRVIFISSMGRSGSTFLSELINYNQSFREMFEPFHNENVPEAALFPYPYYIPRHFKVSKAAADAIELILKGHIVSFWSDSIFPGHYFRDNLLIKDIRTNLMLSWIKENIKVNNIYFILLIRNPISTISSWINSGFGDGSHELNRLLNQSLFTNNYPEFIQLCKQADTTVKKLSLFWAYYYYVPIKEMKRPYIIKYENLKNEKNLINFFEEINLPYPKKNICQYLNKPSKTDALNPTKQLIQFTDDEKYFLQSLLKTTKLDKYYNLN